MIVGRVGEIWRYPVKSLGGECIERAHIDERGIVGDRCWAFIDALSGDIAWGKSSPGLMNLSARYAERHPDYRVFQENVPAVDVTLPNGDTVRSGGSRAADAVGAYVDRKLNLCALEPPDNRGHYRWSEPPDEAKLRSILGIRDDDQIPDLSSYDGELMSTLGECFSPPGSYHDMYPIHLLTTSTVNYMASISEGEFDRRRFRPNLFVETESETDRLVEFDWVGRHLQIGATLLRIAVKTVRCSMPARQQQHYGLAQNAGVARALHQHTDRFLGVYLSVVEGGLVAAGDTVELID